MIIIEAKQGVYLVNEAEIISFAFDQENGKASYTMKSDQVTITLKNGVPHETRISTVTYADVEQVRYANNAKPTSYLYEGSEVQRLSNLVGHLQQELAASRQEQQRLRERNAKLADEVERLNPKPNYDTSSATWG